MGDMAVRMGGLGRCWPGHGFVRMPLDISFSEECRYSVFYCTLMVTESFLDECEGSF